MANLKTKLSILEEKSKNFRKILVLTDLNLIFSKICGRNRCPFAHNWFPKRLYHYICSLRKASMSEVFEIKSRSGVILELIKSNTQ